MKISTCSKRPILQPCGLENLDYQVDPYVGCEHNCYYCYALDQAETDWAEEIQIHGDIMGQLRDELANLPPQTIYMGHKTDPYQPCEAGWRQTRQVLELLLEKGFSASILTKSDLVLRDADLLKEMKSAFVSVSVAFNDDDTRRLFEANTMPTERRIRALHRFKEAGVGTVALLCPIIPYITNVRPLIDMLAPCTDVIWIHGLCMRQRSDRNWQNLETILEDRFPTLKPEIETIVFSKDHPYWTDLRQELTELMAARKLNLEIHV